MDSEDNSTDEGRKKRMPEDDIFGKSKKFIRTPSKKVENEDKLEKVIYMIQNLTVELKEMREEQKEYREELRELREENKQIKQENAELTQKLHEVEKKVDNLEKAKRRNNVVLQGIEMSTNDQNALKVEIEDFIQKVLNVNKEIKGARKLGNRIYLIEMKNSSDKEEIMKNKNKLKELKNIKVFINDDMSKTEREIQGKIRKKAKEELANGNNVRTGFQKIIINDEEWVWNKNTELFEKTGRQRIILKN